MTLPKSKIKDEMADKSKKYQQIKHDADALICFHCRYQEREDSLTAKIESMNSNTKTKVTKQDGSSLPDKTIKELQVVRGSLDDVIGWKLIWQ